MILSRCGPKWPARWQAPGYPPPSGNRMADFDVERMAPPNLAERWPQEIDVIDEKTQAALSQIGREEKSCRRR